MKRAFLIWITLFTMAVVSNVAFGNNRSECEFIGPSGHFNDPKFGHVFRTEDPADSRFWVKAKIDNDSLVVTTRTEIKTKKKAWKKEQTVKAKSLDSTAEFKSALNEFSGKYKSIDAIWLGDENLAMVNRLTGLDSEMGKVSETVLNKVFPGRVTGEGPKNFMELVQFKPPAGEMSYFEKVVRSTPQAKEAIANGYTKVEIFAEGTFGNFKTLRVRFSKP